MIGIGSAKPCAAETGAPPRERDQSRRARPGTPRRTPPLAVDGRSTGRRRDEAEHRRRTQHDPRRSTTTFAANATATTLGHSPTEPLRPTRSLPRGRPARTKINRPDLHPLTVINQPDRPVTARQNDHPYRPFGIGISPVRWLEGRSGKGRPTQRDADERDRAADERDRAADERDRAADERDRAADERDRAAGGSDEGLGRRDRRLVSRESSVDALRRRLDRFAITRREGEVLVLVMDRFTNAEIADVLYISKRTVESHVSSLMRKLGASDRGVLEEVGWRSAEAGVAYRV